MEKGKDKKKNRKKKFVCGAAAAAVCLLAVLAAVGSRLTNKKTVTAEGLQIIKRAEQGNVAAIEEKIEELGRREREAEQAAQAQAQAAATGEDAGAAGEDPRSLKEMFASTVIVGDSIVEGFGVYDVLNLSSVVSKIGIQMQDQESIDAQIATIGELNPQNIFLSYGINDVICTQGNTDLFIEVYKGVIDRIQEVAPEAKIFINSIFPVRSSIRQEKAAYQQVDQYNAALSEMCDAKQLAFVDNTDLVEGEQYYEQDGIHFLAVFYPLWAERMAEVASL